MSRPSITLKCGSENSFFIADRLTVSSTSLAMNAEKSASGRNFSKSAWVGGEGGAESAFIGKACSCCAREAPAGICLSSSSLPRLLQRLKKSSAAMSVPFHLGHVLHFGAAFERRLFVFVFGFGLVICLYESGEPGNDFRRCRHGIDLFAAIHQARRFVV